MSDYFELKDFGMKVKSKIIEEVNGYVKFEIYPDVDVIIFKIMFKEFEYKHATNIKDLESMEENAAVTLANKILDDYRDCLMKSYFKTEKRKEKDRNRRMGVSYDYV